MKPPLISICIPSYKRPKEFGALLDSIAVQYDPTIHEIVVIDDCSPNLNEIQDELNSRDIENLQFKVNPTNYGYDKNLRELIRFSRGQYVLFMGNDDLLEEGALDYYSKIVIDYGDSLGFVLRAYSEFDNVTGNILQTIKYVTEDVYLNPSVEMAAFVYRRSVAIMGMLYNRELALQLDTEKFDGSIYYQLWLSGNIALNHAVYISSRSTTLRRCGLKPDFGNALVEKDSIGDGFYTSRAFFKFVEKMLLIAKSVSKRNSRQRFYDLVLEDYSRYSLPFLMPLRKLGAVEFTKHYRHLTSLGMGKTIYPHAYYISLMLLGTGVVGRLVKVLRKINGTSSIISRKF